MADFEDRELLRQYQKFDHLPEVDKIAAKNLIDTFLTKSNCKSLRIKEIGYDDTYD